MTEEALYEMYYPRGVEEVLEDLRKKIAIKAGLGVTLTGNRLTIRWTHQGLPVHVHMIIEHVENGLPEEEPEDK